jgi:hypothetical protein
MALQRLAPLLQLPRSSASEETRLSLQRCVAAALQPIADAAGATGDSRVLVFSSGSDALALWGYLAHSCLEAAEAEVAAGHKGTPVSLSLVHTSHLSNCSHFTLVHTCSLVHTSSYVQ